MRVVMSEEDTDKAKTSLRVTELCHSASEGLCFDDTDFEGSWKRKIL